MKKQLLNIELEKEIAVIAAFLTTWLLYGCLGTTDFLLNDFSKLYISQATQDNVSIGSRISLFYNAVMGAFILLPLFYYGLNKLRMRFDLHKKHFELSAVLGATGFLLIVAELMGIKSEKGIQFLGLLFLTSLVSMLFSKSKNVLRLVAEPAFFSTVMTLAVIVWTGMVFFFNAHATVIEHSERWFLLIAFGLMGNLLFFKKYSSLFLKKILTYALPLALIPVYIFVSIELLFYFKIKNDFFIPYKWVFLGCVAFSLLTFAFYNFKKRLHWSVNQQLAYVFAPSALLSFLLLVLYVPFLEQPKDLFELANPAISQMKMFGFHEVPFVDYMSSHMFSEQLYGAIYHLIFGYEGNLDFVTYKNFHFLFFFAAAYYFLVQIFKNPATALLFLCTFPFVYVLFEVSLFLTIVLFFAMRKVVAAQALKHYLLLFAWIGILFIWRLDTAVTALFTTATFLPLVFFVERKKIVLRPLLQSLACVFSIIAAMVIVISFLKTPHYLWSNFKSAFHYVAAGQAHGYTIMAKAYHQQFYLFHLILPAIVVLLVLYIVYTLRYQAARFSKVARLSLSAALFLYLIFITNFQRGLVRHNFMEGSDSLLAATFYLATTLLVLSFLKTSRAAWRYIVFIGCAFTLYISLKYFPIGQGASNFETALTQPSIQNLDHYFNDQHFKGKIIEDPTFANETYTAFKQFLDANLTPEQTFLDFSNAPMLYYYCQRNVPAYFCQNLQNTVDDYLQLEHLKRLSPEKVPVVVYSNTPPNWWDNTDGVPNAMRQYLIAQYIYENYRPYGILNKRSIWVAKEGGINGVGKVADTLIQKPQTYNYKKAAYAISKHFEAHENEGLEYLVTVKPVREQVSNPAMTFTLIDPSMGSLPAIFAKIWIDNPVHNQEMKVIVSVDDGSVGTILFTTLENQNSYMVPLSNHYLWHTRSTSKTLQIKTQKGVQIPKVEFYKDIR